MAGARPGAPRPTRRAGPATRRARLSGGRWERIVTLVVPSAAGGPMGAAFLDGLVASRRVWAPEQAEPQPLAFPPAMAPIHPRHAAQELGREASSSPSRAWDSTVKICQRREPTPRPNADAKSLPYACARASVVSPTTLDPRKLSPRNPQSRAASWHLPCTAASIFPRLSTGRDRTEQSCSGRTAHRWAGTDLSLASPLVAWFSRSKVRGPHPGLFSQPNIPEFRAATHCHTHSHICQRDDSRQWINRRRHLGPMIPLERTPSIGWCTRPSAQPNGGHGHQHVLRAPAVRSWDAGLVFVPSRQTGADPAGQDARSFMKTPPPVSQRACRRGLVASPGAPELRSR